MITHKSKKKTTHVAFVLDKSGSMNTIRDATISAFNEQMQEHKINTSNGGEIFLSLVQFNNVVDETFFNQPIEEIVGELDKEQYVPLGGTALYDAIGHTITKLQKVDAPGDNAFLVIILSDGEENSSRKYNAVSLSSQIKELESTGRWTFQYIGCSDSAIKQVQKLGVKTTAFANTDLGTTIMSAKLKGATSTYYASRAMGLTAVDDFMNP